MRLAAIALLLALFAAPAMAKEQAVESDLDKYDRGCMDEYARDLCQEAVRSKIVDSFGAPSAARLARSGWNGVRVFTIDGYSNDMPLISVGRSDDRQTDLEVRIRGPEGPVALEARADRPIRRAADDLRRAVLASPERLPEEPPAPNPEELVICLHPWVVMAEVIEDGRVVRRIRDGCRDDVVFRRAFAVSMLPVEEFPHCNRLYEEHYRNNSARLESCSRLFGPDRIAAADVLNRLFGDFGVRPEYLTDDVRLDTAGAAPLVGAETVSAAWKAIGIEDTWFGAVRADRGHAEVNGRVWRLVGKAEEFADMTQSWVLGSDGAWRISHVTLSSFQPSE